MCHLSPMISGNAKPAFEPVAEAPEASRDAQMRLAIEVAVGRVFGVESDAIEHASRGVARVALARQVAMDLAHVGCGLSLTAAGQSFGRDRTTVAHACLIVEDRRDDPAFDQILDLLEWAVPVMALRPRAYLQPH